MLSSKSLVYLLRNIKISNNNTHKICQSSFYPLYFSRNFSTENVEVQEVSFKEKIQLTRPTCEKWKRPPFLKNFFMGKYDTELLAFPEVLSKEQVYDVEKYVKLLNILYAEKVNSLEIDETGKIPDEVIQDLKDLGLFGRMIPAKYGGLDLSYTACTRLNEVLGLDFSIYSMLTAHEFLASQVILLFGSEEQKNKYLPLLASGKLIAAFCASEFESGSEFISIRTSAENIGGAYSIEGVKCWVTNGAIADIFIVFAKMKNIVDPESPCISVFIVDRNTEGLYVTPQETVTLRGVGTSLVQLKGAIVLEENVIGDLGNGCFMYLKTMEHFRIGMNSFTFGALKVLMDSVTNRIINSERIENSLGDRQLVRTKLSKICSALYGMESVAYFTAALLDSSENPDAAFESAAIKIYNSENTIYCLRELMELFGSSSFMKELHIERFYRDALGLRSFDGPNDLLRLFIGFSGCQLVGAQKSLSVMEWRNRFFFPLNAIKRTLKARKLFAQRIKYDQDLGGHVHPSLVEFGNLLEEKLKRFEYAVEETLVNHGNEVVETQIDPCLLANAAVNMYAQSAVLSRCSRSYCIGLKNCHHELHLTEAFCYEADVDLNNCINKIMLGPARNNEGCHLMVGTQVVDCRGYFPEHPLKYNY